MTINQRSKALDKGLVDDLLTQRRDRFRRLKQEDQHDRYIILAGGGAGSANSGDEQTNEKTKKQSTAHMLLRILCLGFIVPICESSDDTSVKIPERDGFDVNDAISFIKSLLSERPDVLSHTFHAKKSNSAFSSFSTTLLPWILPRLLCASAMSCFRFTDTLKEDSKKLSQKLIQLAVILLRTSIIKIVGGAETARQSMEEMLRASILALAGIGAPSFDNRQPPPLRYTPQHKVAPDAPFTTFYNSPSSEVHKAAEKIQENMSEGIGGVWMQEDHATFTPSWNRVGQHERSQLAHALFFNTCDVLIRISIASPDLFADLGNLAGDLLYSNWACKIGDEMLPCGNLRQGVLDRRKEVVQYALLANTVTLTKETGERLHSILTEEGTISINREGKRMNAHGRLQEWKKGVNGKMEMLGESTHSLSSLVKYGLVKRQRSTRLLASQQIIKIISKMLFEGESREYQRFDSFFADFHTLLKTCNARIKETALLCLFGLGSVVSSLKSEVEANNVQGKVLQLLTLQLGSDPLTKALAFSAITDLAKKQECTTFQLLAPHLNIIAPEIVERMSKTPTLFLEILQLTMQNQSKFLRATLQFTLPRIIEVQDDKTLNLIAKGIGLDVQTMCFNNAPAVLKSLLMILPIAKRDHSIQIFISKVRGTDENTEENFNDGSVDSHITLKSLLKGYSVELLGHLVSNLGDPLPSQRKRAQEGLQYMSATLNDRQRANLSTQSRSAALSQYLKEEILAILSWLNEELMNVHGKKSISHKAKVARSIGALIGIVGESISSVTPQLMATLNTTMQVKELMLPTLESWNTFVTIVRDENTGPFIGQTAAAFLASWPKFGKAEKVAANSILTYIVVDNYAKFAAYLNNGEFPDLSEIRKDIPEVWEKLSISAKKQTPKRPEERLAAILGRVANENASMCGQALQELRVFLLRENNFLDEATTGNVFDPVIGKLVRVLFDTMARDDEEIRDLSLENLGIVGAIDPDRLPVLDERQTNMPLNDFNDKDELTTFAVSLIADVLVGAYKATHDTKHQSALAYAIQELLKFCGFTSALLPAGLASATGLGGSRKESANANSVSLKTRQRWNAHLAIHVETLAPLLESKYLVHHSESTVRTRPFYTSTKSFKEWIQSWTNTLIVEIKGDYASTVFDVFRSVIRDHDLSIAQHILPDLVLNAVISQGDESMHDVHTEIISVLQDQVSGSPKSYSERAAQVVFGILDHLSVWQRARQREKTRANATGAGESDVNKPKRSTRRDVAEVAIQQVENLMEAIPTDLMAKASLRCRAYARSLLNHEKRIRLLQSASEDTGRNAEVQENLEDLHMIYANLEEPDGMEGVSCFVLRPSLDHQIREHESTGRWTSAQSCWEVKIQESPKDLELHIGLLRCLRNLGHYDTMRMHIRGVVASAGSQSKVWQDRLSAFYVEGSCILSDWDEVRKSINSSMRTPQLAMARVMLAMHDHDVVAFQSSIRDARRLVGKSLIGRNKGKSDYLGEYETVSQLHILHEFSMIGQALGLIEHGSSESGVSSLPSAQSSLHSMNDLNKALNIRLDSTLPSFRTREPILSMRRSALSTRSDANLKELAGQCWIASSKIARREGHFQTSYSAALQASQWKVPLAFVQHAKLLAINDQNQAALQEMNNSLRNLSGMDQSWNHSLANAHLFCARLAEASGRHHPNEIVEFYKYCSELDPKSEKIWYQLGRYYDQLQEKDSSDQSGGRIGNPLVQHYNTCKYFLHAANYGTKYFYRTIPRVLTIWLTIGDDENLLNALRKAMTSATSTSNGASKSKTKSLDSASLEHIAQFKKINDMIRRAIRNIAPYQWLAVFPQLVSRVVHRNDSVWKTLQELIAYTVEVYPDQAMWIMVAGLQSTDRNRRDRFLEIVNRVKATVKAVNETRHIAKTIDQMIKMAKELLYLCDCPVDAEVKKMEMGTKFPSLLALAKRGDVILPMQNSLSVTMPPTFSADKDYKVFDDDIPRIVDLDNTIEVMHSLQRPRKIIIKASDGKSYAFLCKPKDDLRKDARLMEFDSMINNLLQSNPDSRKRRLYIRTYAVVTLNEECGLIEWVPNTIGLRHVLHRLYANRGIHLYTQQIKVDMEAARKDPKKAGEIFTKKVLTKYPPVFHEWFLTMFPEPSSWLIARSNYGRTLAVMSMVGHVLGLGDRHGENILFDSVSGDTVHVDLNCLFDKGSTFEIPERVPFRLTQNLVDGLGITGVEGVFRKAAEITMNILREHKDSLMSVLEAMVHDPLVEWNLEGSKSKATGSRADPRIAEARKALDPISRKLLGQLRRHGHHGAWSSVHSTNALVDALIRDATSSTLLAQMYIGWASYL